MICPNCHKTIADDANFCSFCGTPLRTPSAGAPETEPVPEPVPTPVPEPVPVPEAEPVPTPVPEPVAAPEAEAVPAPEAEPEPAPEPGPTPQLGPRPQRGGVPVRKAGKSKTWQIVLLVLLALLMAAAMGVGVYFLKRPSGLADSELAGFLPWNATITANETEDKTQTVEYAYTEMYKYCEVNVSARRTFRYSGGAWSPAPQEEILSETEDWSQLAGNWTISADGVDLSIILTGFSGGAGEGSVSYTDRTGPHTGSFEAFFGQGEELSAPAAGGTQYAFWGQQGVVLDASLVVDRDDGLLYDGDAMDKDAPPKPSPSPKSAGTLQINKGGSAVTVTPAASAAPAAKTLVSTAVLNVRPAPNTDQAPLGTVDIGTVLTYTGSSDGWYEVLYEDQTGYVSGDYIQDLADPGVTPVTVLTADADLTVRADKDDGAEALTTVSAGGRMIALGDAQDGWYQIRYNAGSGYVPAGSVTAGDVLA